MAFKFVVLAACLAFANAGLISSPLAYAGQGYAAQGYATHGYAAPALAHSYAAPAIQTYAHAAPVAYAAPVAHAYAAPAVVTKTIAAPVAVTKTVVDTEYDPNPQYSYGYDVQDALTGDSKSQHETRNGDVVQGSYSLNEADGTRRIVDYTADPINGFNAVVRKEGLVAKAAVIAAPAPIIAKVAAPLAYAAPAVHSYAHAAPAIQTYAHAAPAIQTYAHAAPVAYAAQTYAAAPVAHAYAAPVAHAYAAPVAHGYAAPALAYSAGLHGVNYGTTIAKTLIH